MIATRFITAAGQDGVLVATRRKRTLSFVAAARCSACEGRKEGRKEDAREEVWRVEQWERGK